jgi:hypothetical protein
MRGQQNPRQNPSMHQAGLAEFGAGLVAMELQHGIVDDSLSLSQTVKRIMDINVVNLAIFSMLRQVLRTRVRNA